MGGRSIFAWAHPGGSVDQLLKVAALPSDEQALKIWNQWLQTHQLDEIQFREMRLLAHTVPRLERIAPQSPAHQRLIQSTRLLWARSQMALAEIRPALQTLHRANINMMALKGAARISRDPQAIKTRIVNDVDQNLVRRLVPDAVGGLLGELPTLPSQQAILLGWAVPTPVLVRIRDLGKSQRPRSDDPHFWRAWLGKEGINPDWARITRSWENPEE